MVAWGSSNMGYANSVSTAKCSFTVNMDGVLAIEYSVSSQSGNDKLWISKLNTTLPDSSLNGGGVNPAGFNADDCLVAGVSGEIVRNVVSLPITAGAHFFYAAFTKDAATDTGLDRAIVHGIVVHAYSTAISIAARDDLDFTEESNAVMPPIVSITERDELELTEADACDASVGENGLHIQIKEVLELTETTDAVMPTSVTITASDTLEFAEDDVAELKARRSITASDVLSFTEDEEMDVPVRKSITANDTLSFTEDDEETIT